MNDKGKPYSIEEISDKKNSLVIIYNHGSIQDVKQDPCKAKPTFGYIWDKSRVYHLHLVTISYSITKK